MNLIDVIIMAVVFVGFVLGFKDGIIRKLIGLVGLAAAIVLAIYYSNAVGRIIEKIFLIEFYMAKIVAVVFILITVIAIFSIIKRIVHPYDKINNLVNQILGGIVGVIQILFFLSAVFFILNVFNAPSKNTRKSSVFYQKVYELLPATINYISNYSPKTRKLIKEYFDQKDTLK